MNIKNMISKVLGNPIVILAFRIIVGYVFISFGISKIVDPTLFAKEIVNYDFAPIWSLNIIALFLPWLELTTGLMLIFGVSLKANSILIGLMLVWFIFMVSVAWGRGLDINCGCSSINPIKVGLKKIIENSIFLLMCIMIMYFPHNKLTISNPSCKDCESFK